MLDVLFEQELVQNTGLGAEAILRRLLHITSMRTRRVGCHSHLCSLFCLLYFTNGQYEQLSQGQVQGLCERRCGRIAKSQSDCNREWSQCVKQHWQHARWHWILG